MSHIVICGVSELRKDLKAKKPTQNKTTPESTPKMSQADVINSRTETVTALLTGFGVKFDDAAKKGIAAIMADTLKMNKKEFDEFVETFAKTLAKDAVDKLIGKQEKKLDLPFLSDKSAGAIGAGSAVKFESMPTLESKDLHDPRFKPKTAAGVMGAGIIGGASGLTPKSPELPTQSPEEDAAAFYKAAEKYSVLSGISPTKCNILGCKPCADAYSKAAESVLGGMRFSAASISPRRPDITDEAILKAPPTSFYTIYLADRGPSNDITRVQWRCKKLKNAIRKAEKLLRELKCPKNELAVIVRCDLENVYNYMDPRTTLLINPGNKDHIDSAAVYRNTPIRAYMIGPPLDKTYPSKDVFQRVF